MRERSAPRRAATARRTGPGVRLVLEYDPEGFVEKVGDWLNIVSRQAQNDLEKFKEFIEPFRVTISDFR